MKKFIAIFGIVFVLGLGAHMRRADAQQYYQISTTTATTTYYTVISTSSPSSAATSTSSNAATTTNATSTPLGGSLQGQLVVLQTKAIVLIGQLIAQVSASSTTDASVSQAMRNLRLAWIGMAQNQISLIRMVFHI